MRLTLQTDLISRDGTVDQDARMLNCFAEGEEVIKRPAVNSNLVDVTGAAQGGIDNDSKVYAIFGDTLKSYDSAYSLVDDISL